MADSFSAKAALILPRPGCCKWREDDGDWCDAPMVRGSYCREHGARVYSPPPLRAKLTVACRKPT
jgi:hypothetical protein